jgi:hypothetical protein
MKTFVILAAFLFANTAFSSQIITYWAHSDTCEGEASGIIYLSNDGAGNLICKRWKAADNGQSIWSIKIANDCIDNRDERSAAAICENFAD